MFEEGGKYRIFVLSWIWSDNSVSMKSGQCSSSSHFCFLKRTTPFCGNEETSKNGKWKITWGMSGWEYSIKCIESAVSRMAYQVDLECVWTWLVLWGLQQIVRKFKGAGHMTIVKEIWRQGVFKSGRYLHLYQPEVPFIWGSGWYLWGTRSHLVELVIQ